MKPAPLPEPDEKREASDTLSSFPCSICGRSFVPDRLSRCETCGAFCCRDCLKINYDRKTEEEYLPTQVLCYHCYHSMK